MKEFRFTIQYQFGQTTGIKEILAADQQQAIAKLWEEISRTGQMLVFNTYRSAAIVNIQF